MTNMRGHCLEHGPSGRIGLCCDQWHDARDGWKVRLYPEGDFGGFNCLLSECRAARFVPYLIWDRDRQEAADKRRVG